MGRTYTSQIPLTQTCETPYCGYVYKYFCTRCRHYLTTCRCSGVHGACHCPNGQYWAAPGERRAVAAQSPWQDITITQYPTS